MTIEASTIKSADAADANRSDAGLEPQRAARRRSIAIALTLGGMVVLFYAATIVRLGANVVNKSW